ncbi:hypothetical protein niasHS_001750 [Heterodera schachtii]|uniref:Fibronectin type-III domain-containing protein n=1 Tax=Heterodera schachtii TaxID=97005 RepID=A0ABD2KBY5_HETSC
MLLDSVCTSLESNNTNNNNSYAKHHRFMPKWCKVDDLGRPTPPPRHGHRAVTIKGLMLVFGGGNEGIVNELHVYDSSTNTWCVPDLRGHRPPGFAAYGMVTNQSKVFIFGGMIEYGRYSNDLYELQINRWEWRKLNIQILEGLPAPCPRLGHTFTMGSNNIAYVFGGLANISENRRENMPKYLNDLYAIDLSTAPNGLSWHCPKTNCQPPPPRESHTAVHFTTNTGNEQLIIYGGMNGQRLGDVWILDLESMNWSNPLPQGFGPLPRSLHTANLIENRMFIFGGWVPIDPDDKLERPNQGWKCTNTLAVLNLSTLRWELSLGPPTFDTTITTYSIDSCWPTARAGHCSAVINKRIYIWSGRDGYKKLQNSQVCCKDMFYLETEPPAVPSSIQLVKASVNSLEISWSPSTTADRYVLQIQRAEHQSDPEKVGRRSAGGVRVAQRQQHFANVGAGGGGTPLSSSSHSQQQRAVLTGGGGSSNSASSSPVRAFRPTSMSNTVTGSSSPFHHRRYYQQQPHHHQQQLHLSTASASVSSSPVLLAARPLRIKPSAGATSSCPRPSSIVVQQQPQQQLRFVEQHMNRNDIASTGVNVGGGTTDAAVVTASSSPVSSLHHHHHHHHQQHQQLNMTTPRTIVVHKSSSSLVPSSDAEGGGGGVADPATSTTIPPLVAGPKRFYVHTSAPSHQQQQHVVAAVVGAQQPPVIVRRQLPNCPPRQPRQDIATSSNTFDILAPPAKMVKHMEFVPTVSGIISPTEPPLSSTTTTKTTTYSVPAAPVVVDQTMPHNILETFLNEAENFVEHHGQPPCNVDNANENIDSQSAEQQQQQFDGTTGDGGDGNPLAVEAKTAAAPHQHHDQIGDDDDDDEGGGDDYDEKEINNEQQQQQIETGGGEEGGQEGGKNIANDNDDDDDDAKSKWTTTSDAEALGMTMTKSEDNNNMFSTRATTTNNANDNTTDKSDVEKTTDDNSVVVVGDEYAQLGVEQMRAIDPDSEKDAAALKEEAAERHSAAQLLQPLERDYEQQQQQQQQQEDDQLLLDVSAVVDEPLPEEQQQHNQQQQQHVVGGVAGGGEQSQQHFATEEEEEQPVGSDEQPQPQQVVQQQQYGFRHYQQQPQFQHVPADMVATGGGRATAATQQHQQHPIDAEKEEMEEEQDELGNSIRIGTRIVSIAEQQHVQQLLPMSVVESSSSSTHERRQQQQQDITAAQPEHHQHPIPIGQRRSASSSASDFVAQYSPFDSGNKWFHVVDLPSSEQRFVITEYSVPCYDRGGGDGSGSATTTTESVRRKRRAIEYASQLPDEQQQQQQEQQQKTAATEQIALEPGTLYRIRVRAVNSVGCSAWSQPVSFKTCVPGFPGSPTSIKITKCPEGVYISWDPPLSPNGQIEEYSVFLLMRSPQHQQQHASMMRSQQQQQQQSVAVSSFTRVYMGSAPNCVISHSVLGMAHVDTASTPKPAIIFRISARNEKGYGSATQVRWLQESPRVLPLAVMPPGTLQPMPHGTLLTTTTTGPSLPSSLPSSSDTTAQLVMPQQQQQLYHHQHHHVLSLPSSASAGGRAVHQHQHRRSAASPAAVVYQQPQQQQHQQHYHHNQQRSTAANMMMNSSGPANMNISVREFLSNSNNAAASRGGDR